jgi:copper chaperone CopZ
MKYTLSIFLLAIILIGCGKQDNKTSEQTDTDVNVNRQQISIQTSGMTCTGCEKTIKSKVKKINGVIEVNADHTTGVVNCEYDANITNPDAIKDAITSSGYKIKENQ